MDRRSQLRRDIATLFERMRRIELLLAVMLGMKGVEFIKALML